MSAVGEQDGARALGELLDRQALRRRHAPRERDHVGAPTRSATSCATSVGVVPTEMPTASSASFFA